jgi:hypothetical protein
LLHLPSVILRHEKLTISLEKEKLLATLKIEELTMNMEENNTCRL